MTAGDVVVTTGASVAADPSKTVEVWFPKYTSLVNLNVIFPSRGTLVKVTMMSRVLLKEGVGAIGSVISFSRLSNTANVPNVNVNI